MSISEQVKELRDKANVFERSGCAVDGIVKAFREAADTIESLSEKLQGRIWSGQRRIAAGGFRVVNGFQELLENILCAKRIRYFRL